MKILCVIAALVLIFTIVFVIMGAANSTQDPNADGAQDFEPSYTFAPDTSAAPAQTSAPAETTTAPDAALTTTPPETTQAPQTTAAPTGSLTPLPESSLILPETPDAGLEYQDSIIFLGDSTSYGMIPYKVLTDGQNTKQVWTSATNTLTLDQAVRKTIKYPETGAEITAAQAAAEKKPAYLIITLGVNGISFMNEEQFITEYKKLVDSIKQASPDTKIILQSIFPVARNYDRLEQINNEKITLANTWVLKVAEQCGVKYLNTAPTLCDSEGWLIEKYSNGDGMHLCAEGFNVILKYIRTHAYTE